MDLLNAETALLGLLSEKPMHPYQIEQEVKNRDMRFWTDLSMSSIYKLLRKLEKEGLVERVNEVSLENRLRKLYNLSEMGKESLNKKIEAILSNPEHIRWQIDIGTYNCHLLPDAVIKNSLENYKTALQKSIKGYLDLQRFLKDSGCPPHRLAIAERPVFLLEAEIQWVDSYLKKLRNEKEV